MTKPTKWHVCPAKTQISLGICPVWSESSLSAWRKLGSFATHWVHSEDSHQTGHAILLVLSWGGSNVRIIRAVFVGFVMRGLIWILWVYHTVMHPNDADWMANSVDLVRVWSGSTLFAKTCLSENLRSLWYMYLYFYLPFTFLTEVEDSLFRYSLGNVHLWAYTCHTHVGRVRLNLYTTLAT